MKLLLNQYFLSFIISFFLANYCLIYLIPFLKEYFLDIPNSRSSHKKPVPRGGGIIFLISGSLGGLYFNNTLPLICIPLAILGLIDDKTNLPRILRYFGQIITSIFLLINLRDSWLINLDLNFILIFFFYFILIFFMTAIINFINFMDGLDGFVSSSMLLIYLFISLNYSPSLFPLCGGLMAFLICNWQPAKIFMGDVGSTFLGSLFAATLLDMQSPQISLNLLLIISPLLYDAAFCVLRRFLSGKNIFEAHKSHLYQRLNQAGWSHYQVSLLYLLFILLLITCSVFFDLEVQILISIVTLLVGIIIDKLFAYPFYKCN